MIVGFVHWELVRTDDRAERGDVQSTLLGDKD